MSKNAKHRNRPTENTPEENENVTRITDITSVTDEPAPFLGDSDADVEPEKEMDPLLSKKAGSSQNKVKNLTALLVLVTGLFVGSLCVDIAQLATKSGFSNRVLEKTDVVSAAGKTWVAYNEPIVRVSVVTDKTCENCQTDEALVWLRRVIPTVSVEQIDVNDDKRAKDLVKSSKLVSIPAFIFSEDVTKISIYAQAEQLFAKVDGGYLLDTTQVGIPVGKFLELPRVDDSSVKIGSMDAPVRVVEFTDFQCPYCKVFHATLKKELEAYGDKVLYVYKSFPLNFHAQAEPAALAGECAYEQGKFTEYADNLFLKQDEWGKTTDTKAFKDYAVALNLDAEKFNQCLDTKKYQDALDADKEEGTKFGISGTPGTFVNGVFLNGAIPAEQLKAAIDAEIENASKGEEKK